MIAAAWFAVGRVVDFKESVSFNREFRKIVDFEIELVKHSCVSASRSIYHVDVRPNHHIVSARLGSAIARECRIYGRNAISGDVHVAEDAFCLLVAHHIIKHGESHTKAFGVVVLLAVSVDEVEKAVCGFVVEVLANAFLELLRLILIGVAVFTTLPHHVGKAKVSLIVDAVGAETHYLVGIVVEHIAIVVARLEDWLIVAGYAVLKHGRTGE